MAGKTSKLKAGKISKATGAAPGRAKKVAASIVSAKSKGDDAKPKLKRIRGEFSMPAGDFALIAELKTRSKTAGRPVKKNELLRAGLHNLSGMTNDQLQAALRRLPPVAAKAPKKVK